MTNQTIPYDEFAKTDLPIKLNYNLIVGIYFIIPFIFLVIFFDYFITGLEFSKSLMNNNYHIFLIITLFLQTPHSIASILTFFDRGYISAYKFKLIKLCIIIALTSIAWKLNDNLLLLAVIIYNFYHYSSQQAGITALLAKNKSRTHEIWKWATCIIFLSGLFGAAGISGPYPVNLEPFKGILYAILIVLFSGFIAVSAILARQSQTRIGALYIAVNSFMLITYFGLFLSGLWFYMVVIPVFLHGMTALLCYINHNANRNAKNPVNFISRFRNILPMPEYMLTPLAAILGTGVLTLAGHSFPDYYSYMIALLNIIHLYFDTFMWRKGAPHRAYLHT
jgi:hypothetical protein